MKTLLLTLGAALFFSTALAQVTNSPTVSTNSAPVAPVAPAGDPGLSTESITGLLDFGEIKGLKVTLDPKVLDEGSVGLDFSAIYERMVLGEDGVAGNKLYADVRANGFLATDREDSQNSIIAEGRFSGNLFLGGERTITPAQQRRVLELENLMEKNRFGPEVESYSREHKAILSSKPPRYAAFDLHFKNESDQSFDDSQRALGAGFASDVGLFFGDDKGARIFDAPFALLRSREAAQHYKPRLIRFYVGYDYVTDSDIEERKKLTDDDGFSRLTAQVAWSTLIFKNVQIRLSEQMYYEISASRSIKDAEKDFTSFFEVSASIPIDKDKDKRLFVKYTTGKLPPTLKNSSQYSVGFSMDFGGLKEAHSQ